MAAVRVLAPAKVNLYLHVGPPGSDGYHPIVSHMAFADLGDTVSAEPGEGLSLAVAGAFAEGLPTGDGNLVFRAARALLDAHGAKGARLVLDKALPVAAGLGGGSSDAGAALRALNAALGLNAAGTTLEAVAAGLGADGAACFRAEAVIARGRGEVLSPPPAWPALDAVLVNPRVGLSTAAAYRRFDQRGDFQPLEPEEPPPEAADAETACAWLARQRNDLEAPALDMAPQVGEVLAALADRPEALLARMSGSGATCFALCASAAAAAALAADLAAARSGWWVRACRLS